MGIRFRNVVGTVKRPTITKYYNSSIGKHSPGPRTEHPNSVCLNTCTNKQYK